MSKDINNLYKLCPSCDGEVEILDAYRNLTPRPEGNKYEIICKECGITVFYGKSIHKFRNI